MPGVTYDRSSSPSSARTPLSENGGDYPSDSLYPAVSFPGYAEKPLSQQLEPIAVIGMGEFLNHALVFSKLTLNRMPLARRCQLPSSVLGHDDTTEDWPHG